ncbi:MAG: c-type cytochrome [Candidatus Binatia bacterium]
MKILRITGTWLVITLILGAVLATSQSLAGSVEGEKIFKGKGCGGCHALTGPAKVKSIQDRLKRKGPDLWFAGSKFKEKWLNEWLKKPVAIRGVKWGTLEIGNEKHAGLSKNEAREVAAYLMTLVDKYTAKGVIKEGKKLSRSKRLKAKRLFEKKQACYSCHKTPVKKRKKVLRVIGGFTGPTFVDAGKRLRGDWIYSFLKEPQSYEPFGRMPVYGDKVQDKFSDKDLKLLAGYLLTF